MRVEVEDIIPSPEADDPLLVQAKRVVAASEVMVGRNRLAKELDITPHRARTLLEQLSNNGTAP
jgi:hypothetical protein